MFNAFCNPSVQNLFIDPENGPYSVKDAVQHFLEHRLVGGRGGGGFFFKPNIACDVQFLMQQIEFREALGDLNESADPMTAVDGMRTDVQNQYLQLQNDFEAQYIAANYNDALDTVAKMQFFSKLLVEIDQREEELEDF